MHYFRLANNRRSHGSPRQHQRFSAVAENGGFTAGARRLNFSTSTVSEGLRYAFYPFGEDWHFIDPAGRPLVVRVAGNLITASVDVLRAAAFAGGGVLLTAPFAHHEELAAGSLVRLLPDYQTVEFPIIAVYPHRRQLAAKLRVFIDALITLFAGQQWLTANN